MLEFLLGTVTISQLIDSLFTEIKHNRLHELYSEINVSLDKMLNYMHQFYGNLRVDLNVEMLQLVTRVSTLIFKDHPNTHDYDRASCIRYAIVKILSEIYSDHDSLIKFRINVLHNIHSPESLLSSHDLDNLVAKHLSDDLSIFISKLLIANLVLKFDITIMNCAKSLFTWMRGREMHASLTRRDIKMVNISDTHYMLCNLLSDIDRRQMWGNSALAIKVSRVIKPNTHWNNSTHYSHNDIIIDHFPDSCAIYFSLGISLEVELNDQVHDINPGDAVYINFKEYEHCSIRNIDREDDNSRLVCVTTYLTPMSSDRYIGFSSAVNEVYMCD